MVNYVLQVLIGVIIGIPLWLILMRFFYNKSNPKIAAQKNKKGKLTFKPRGRYLINIIIRSESDHLLKLRHNDLNFKFKLWNKSYSVQRDYLYRKKKNPLKGLFDRIVKGINREYMIVFWENEPEAIKILESINDPVMINSLRSSSILGKALKEMMRRAIGGGKNIILLAAIIIIVTLAVTKYLGYW